MPTAACLRMRPLAGAGPVERDVLARLPDVAPLEAEHVYLVGRRLSPSGDAVGAGLASGRIVRLYALPRQCRRPSQRFSARELPFRMCQARTPSQSPDVGGWAK